MDVTAIYEFPVPIWITCETLGDTYPTGIGRLQFDISTPQDSPPNGAAPELAGLSHPLLSDTSIMWAHEYGAFIPESLRPATTIQRVAITNVTAPEYPDRDWYGSDHQLAARIEEWYDQIRTWVEVLTGQDLDPRHRVYDAEAVGTGLTFIEPDHQDALGMIITTPHITPLRKMEWATILEQVRRGEEPPLEEVLSRDARAAHRRHANRRAIIDAATAIEIVLSRHINGQSPQLPASQQKRLQGTPSLGTYISIAEDSHLNLSTTYDELRNVSKVRNDAAHRGYAPDSWETGAIVQTMINFLGAHGQYRRVTSSEPDGGEIVLGEN